MLAWSECSTSKDTNCIWTSSQGIVFRTASSAPSTSGIEYYHLIFYQFSVAIMTEQQELWTLLSNLCKNPANSLNQPFCHRFQYLTKAEIINTFVHIQRKKQWVKRVAFNNIYFSVFNSCSPLKYTGCPKKKFMLGNQQNFRTDGHSEVCEEANWGYFWVLNISRPLPEV